mgnify:CR=1 FL=1
MHLVLGGIITGLLLAGYLNAAFKIESPSIPDDWETLFVGFIALLSYLLHRKQVRMEEDRRRDISTAALGHDLSAVCHYAEGCLEYAYKFYKILMEKQLVDDELHGPYPKDVDVQAYYRGLEERRIANEKASTEFKKKRPPCLPQELIDRLAKAAAEAKSQELLDLLNTYQVQQSRISDGATRFAKGQIGEVIAITTAHNALSAMQDAARVNILASRLFDLPRKGWEFYSDDVNDDEINRKISFLVGFDPPQGD